jgi:hypothetical protein
MARGEMKIRAVLILWKRPGLGGGFSRGQTLTYPAKTTGKQIEADLARRWPNHRIWNTSGIPHGDLTVALTPKDPP